MEKNLEQDVAEFFLQFQVGARIDGFESFVSFLDEVGLQRLVGLLCVPGTTAWGAQAVHEADELSKSIAGVHRGVVVRCLGSQVELPSSEFKSLSAATSTGVRLVRHA